MFSCLFLSLFLSLTPHPILSPQSMDADEQVDGLVGQFWEATGLCARARVACIPVPLCRDTAWSSERMHGEVT